MQPVDAHVGNLNDGILTVEFQGKRCDGVSVGMATEGGDAVPRAKKLIVQLAVFGTGNDIDLWDEGDDGNEQGWLEDEQPFLDDVGEDLEESCEASDPVSVINPTGSRD
ncbi:MULTISPECIES: hypothetical protein [Rhizobium]|uniref:hypothetical protein n=1 Tax=Rhizobium TaxID=379 RepID=UPI00046282D8|nr:MULTISPECIES: hypothetical protein [Rhizobium]MCS0461015.1 hypothetical protein [Rhizobium favelukesii]UFS85632.1 hypothetical protein LPB79_35580 [Rhizobium sp. T136]